MYAYEMQICCYSNVKYYVGIKFHVYHLVTILWGFCFAIFLSVTRRFSINVFVVL
jgi:hypothetical protein